MLPKTDRAQGRKRAPQTREAVTLERTAIDTLLPSRKAKPSVTDQETKACAKVKETRRSNSDKTAVKLFQTTTKVNECRGTECVRTAPRPEGREKTQARRSREATGVQKGLTQKCTETLKQISSKKAWPENSHKAGTTHEEEPKSSKGRATLSDNKSEPESTNENPYKEESSQSGNKIGKFADGVRETANGKPGRGETAPTGLENKTWTGAFSKTKLESSNGKTEIETGVEEFSKSELEVTKGKTEREAFSTAEDSRI